MFADQADTNATPGVAKKAPTRVWISSFQPLTVTTDHREDLPRPCTPQIPQSIGRNWKTNYDSFSNRLVEAAKKADLDTESLGKMLRTIREKEGADTAILPVEADSTWFQGEPVWEIHLRWEYSRDLGEGDMIHICSYTYTRRTLKLVNATRCD
jgi:hypothetical protein